MPICTNCATPTAYLYTVYDTKYNFRLEQCVSSLSGYVGLIWLRPTNHY